jgi:hypothetical protein
MTDVAVQFICQPLYINPEYVVKVCIIGTMSVVDE